MKKLFLISAIWGLIIVPVFMTNLLIYANEVNSHQIILMATVLPQRFIVVDDTLTIKQVFSNTIRDVRPAVYLDSMDGKEIPYSDAIIDQYVLLKPTLEFSHSGVVYQRENRPVMAVIKAIFRKFSWWGDF